ncbi:MAG: hypothetical protein JF571_11945, partial [Asticcacaulis sp.]|nr:hypothetical protein [Asticcacaulis sp.]
MRRAAAFGFIAMFMRKHRSALAKTADTFGLRRTAFPHIALAVFLTVLPYGATAAEPVSVVSREPLYAGLVKSAKKLKAETDRLAVRPALGTLRTARFKTYARDIHALSANDLKGHYVLCDRGTDNDLKCI